MPANTTHPEYNQFSPDWSRARAVLAGEDAVKAAGKAFLPALDSQSTEDYAAYLQRVSFFNATARTAESYLGLIFRRAPFVKAPASPTLYRAFAAFAADADLLDTTLTSYARNIVREVIGVGRASTLMDWQPEDRRATVSFYPAENIINWHVARVNGRMLPTLIVLRESATRDPSLLEPNAPAPDEFVQDTVEQLRVLRLVDARTLVSNSPEQLKPSPRQQYAYIVELYQKRPQSSSPITRHPSPSWQCIHKSVPRRLISPLPLIPFVFHGPSHSRPDIERPPLTDIITTNLYHYRLSADYNHGLHYTALPTAWVSGFGRNNRLQVGSSTAWVAELPGASAGYLEFKGEGLNTFHHAMDRAERHMAVLGSRMLEDLKKVGETATAIELRQAGEHSVLSSIATAVSESLTQVLRWVYWWSSSEVTPDAIPQGEVMLTLNTDFTTKGMSSQDLQAVVTAWQKGALSEDSMHDLMRKGEILPDSRTNKEEQHLIKVGTLAGPARASTRKPPPSHLTRLTRLTRLTGPTSRTGPTPQRPKPPCSPGPTQKWLLRDGGSGKLTQITMKKPKSLSGGDAQGVSRRRFILSSTGALAGAALGVSWDSSPAAEPAGQHPLPNRAAQAPSSPVALLRCESYEPRVFRRALEKSFDLIGGIKPLVRDRTVAVKLNLTGLSWKPVFGFPAQETYQTQPNTVAALCALLAEAGARRIVLLENLYWEKPFEQVLIEAGWDVKAIHSAGHHRVSFEDTRNRGQWPGYSRFKVPWGGFVYPAFDLNQRFEKSDVLVSLAKLKQHATAGITGAVKNCFGNTPTALYGDTAPDEKGLIHRAVMFHGGGKTVPSGVPAELEHGLPKKGPIRVPHIVADIFGARPTDLNIVDGIRTIRGGEGHWNQGIGLMEPKVLLVGKNGVCTDSVATAVMGFDPQAAEGQAPFQGANHLQLLAQARVGTNDLGRIEMRGATVKDVLCPFQPKTG